MKKVLYLFAFAVLGFMQPAFSNNIAVSNVSLTGQNTTAGPLDGPIRAGAFAGAATTREQSGATYYGIMEMNGNLVEQVVNVSNNAVSNGYTGAHGDGVLSRGGNANTAAWPGLISGEVTDGASGGSGGRGGEWFTQSYTITLSKCNSARATISGRFSGFGIRGVRTAQ